MKFVGSLLITFLVAGAAAITDFMFGEVTSFGAIRSDARMFKSEAAYTIFSTKNIVPNISHEYKNPHRDEGARLLPRSNPRKFQSNRNGAVLPVHEANGKEPSRIIFLGGSTTENNEVDQGFRFPGLVGKHLQEIGINIESVNFGVRGHTTIDSINTLVNRVDELDAKYVIMMHNINDRLRSATPSGYTGIKGSVQPTSGRAVFIAGKNFFQSLWDFVSYQSNIIFWIRFNNRWSDAWLDDEPIEDAIKISPDSSAGEPNIDAFKRNLRVFIASSKALNIIPILMTQPLGEKNSDQAAFNSAIIEVASQENVRAIDLANALGANPDWAFLSDGVHFNNDGSIKSAQIISRHLSEYFDYEKSVGFNSNATFVPVNKVTSRCREPQMGEEPVLSEAWRLGGIEGRYPKLSMNGHWLLYQVRVEGYDMVKLVNTKTGDTHELTTGQTVHHRHPTFLSVDNEKIVVIYGAGFDEKNPRHPERLVAHEWPENKFKYITPSNFSASIPSVGNEQLLFAGIDLNSGDRQPNIFSLKLGNENKISKLTDAPYEQWRPVQSINGDIFYIARDNLNFDVFQENQSGVKKIPQSSSSDEWDPDISSDGRYLIFASKETGDWELWLANLANKENTSKLRTQHSDEWDPAFALKDRMILFASADGNGSQLMGACLYQ